MQLALQYLSHTQQLLAQKVHTTQLYITEQEKQLANCHAVHKKQKQKARHYEQQIEKLNEQALHYELLAKRVCPSLLDKRGRLIQERLRADAASIQGVAEGHTLFPGLEDYYRRLAEGQDRLKAGEMRQEPPRMSEENPIGMTEGLERPNARPEDLNKEPLSQPATVNALDSRPVVAPASGPAAHSMVPKDRGQEVAKAIEVKEGEAEQQPANQPLQTIVTDQTQQEKAIDTDSYGNVYRQALSGIREPVRKIKEEESKKEPGASEDGTNKDERKEFDVSNPEKEDDLASLSMSLSQTGSLLPPVSTRRQPSHPLALGKKQENIASQPAYLADSVKHTSYCPDVKEATKEEEIEENITDNKE